MTGLGGHGTVMSMSKKLREFRLWVNVNDHREAEKVAGRSGESVAAMYRRAMREYLERSKGVKR